MGKVTVTYTAATAPAVTTQAASSPSTSGATLNGTVTANGGASLTDRGFYWKTSSGVTTSDSQLSEGGTSVAAFSKTLGSLSVNTIYYYRAYAVNSAGTGIGSSDVSFYTLANTPSAPTVNGATINSLNVAITSGDGNPSATVYAIQETTSGNYVQTGGTLGASAVYQTAATWGTKTVTGLSASTTYTFQVKAQNGASTDTAFSSTASGTTLTRAGGLGCEHADRYGPSPWSPGTSDSHVTIGGLTRGTGMTRGARLLREVGAPRVWINGLQPDAISGLRLCYLYRYGKHQFQSVLCGHQQV